MDWLSMCVYLCVCVWVAVSVESWSWIASVFTRPLNKAFLSVFLVFGIWDFGMVVVFFLFFFSCHCVFLLCLFLRYIFGLNLSSLLLFLQTRSFSKKKKKRKKAQSSSPFFLSLPPFLCHVVKISFVIFGLCTPTCISAVSSISLLKSCWFVFLQRERLMSISRVIDKKVPRCLLPICLDR